ncbi:DUF6531 domain-containing protein, partial [Aquimarina litoralis]|uniref:DUF6531 domain-containing protein n=1 Tax=Aquimarina litoralis TaxID=584605 RepID=UPI001C56AF88
MARQFVPDGETIKCSFGKGSSNLKIDRPSTTIMFKKKWATEVDSNITKFAGCTCPANVSKACTPKLQKWLPNTVAQSVNNGGNRFLLSSSKTVCTTYGGIIEIDLEDFSPTEKHEDFASKNSDDNTSTDNSSNAPSKKEEPEENKYSSGKKRRAERIRKRKQQRENNFEDTTGQKIWDFVKDMGRHANPMELIPNLWHYGTGIASQLWDDFKKSVDLLINIGATSGDLAIYIGERSFTYLKALELTNDKLYAQQLAKNIATDAQLKEWMNKQRKEFPEKFKSIPDGVGKWVDKKEDKILNAPTDQAMKEVGRSVVELIGFGKAVKAGRKVFTKDFWTGLNLKTTAKDYVANVLTAGLASKFPAVQNAYNILKKAEKTGDYKKAAQEMKALAKAINEGKGPKLFHEEPPKETTKQQKKTPDNSKKNTSKNHTKAKNGCPTAGDPVDVISGTNIYDFVDFEIPGIIPISWKRVWYSDSAYKGPMGHGVHHNYDIHLTHRSEDSLLTLADGRPAFFSLLNSENKSEYNRSEKLQLTYINSSTYHLYDFKTKLTYVLTDHSRTYKLSKIIKDEQAFIQFNYQDSYLNEIIDTADRRIKIHYDTAQRIVEITQHHRSEKRTLVSYGYNEAGDLAKITDASGKSVIAVYKNHLMVSKTHREGATCYWEYESYQTGARCTHTWLEGGTLDYKFLYHEKYSEVWDSYGNKTTYHHENNNPVKIIDPLDGITINEYNQFDELIRTIDQEGLQTQYTYDTRGNQTSVRYPDGAEVESSYDDQGNLLLQTSPEGGVFSRFFKNNKLNTIMYPDQTMQTFEYNEHGLISKIADANENIIQLFYDDDHNLNHMISPNKEESFWEYDVWGQCIKMVNPAKQQQQFSYDNLGNISKIRLPDKGNIQLTYDSYGRILQAIDNNRILNYEYTILGNLKSREQDGRKVLFRYDKEEKLIGVINEHKESYHFTRDALGNIIREEGFDQITRNFIRDKAGKIVKEEKSNNKYSTYEYDKAGRVSRIEYHDDSWATFDYNKDGLLTQAVNPNSITKINRDEAGRVVSEEQDGHTISFSYNDKGQQSKIQSSLGASIRLKYTELGEVSSVKAKNKGNSIWKANFKYNSLGMETERSLPGGIKTNWSYDQAGRHRQQVVQKREVETRRRTYTWDVNHKLKKIVDNLTQGIVNFDYDDFNNLAWAKYEDKSYDYKLPDEVG